MQGNILFSNEFARRYGGEGIVSISVHPGNINTDLARNASSFVKILGRIITYPVSYGAINSLYAGTSSAAGELNGKVSIPTSGFARGNATPPFQYVTAWARVTLPHQRALDTDLAEKLWVWSEEQVKEI